MGVESLSRSGQHKRRVELPESNKLPAQMSMNSKKHKTQQKAVRVDPQQHEVILDEIQRREAVEHDMVLEESSDDESDNEGDVGESVEGAKDNPWMDKRNKSLEEYQKKMAGNKQSFAKPKHLK